MRISDWRSDVCSSDLQLTDRLRAAGGFRYTWDTRNTVLHNRQILGIPSNAPVAGTPLGVNCNRDMPDAPPTATECNQTQNAKLDYPAWTFGHDRQAPDELCLSAVTLVDPQDGGRNV